MGDVELPKWTIGDKFYIERSRGHETWQVSGEPFREGSVDGEQWWYPMTYSVTLNFKESELLEEMKWGG